jgi:PAS domain S-box-containing protein
MAGKYHLRRAILRQISTASNVATPGSLRFGGAVAHGPSAFDHQLLAIIPALLFTSRPDGSWDAVSPPFCTYTGLPPEALTGLGWVAALHNDDQAPSLARWQSATASATAWEQEHRLRGADGVYRWFRTRCAPQRDAAGALRGWAGIVAPVESERQLAAERALRRSAEQARAERDSTLEIVAHELRAPLTVLLGQATLLRRRLKSREDAEPGDLRAVETLVAQTNRLKDLVSALMDATQVDHGQLRICATTLDLGALVERVVQALAPTLPAHRLRLHADATPLWVAGDALRLEQVLQNLLQNAVKYSPHGGEIAVRSVARDGQVQIDVADQGLGIPAAMQPYLFQRYGRARAEDRRLPGGLGLGLYLCKAIIDLHGGSITVQSEEGAGCVVTLLLPRVSPQRPRHDSSHPDAEVALVVR